MQQNAALKWSSTANTPVQTPSLLLVDDDRTMRAMLAEALEQMGYAVHMASDGKEALGMLHTHPNGFDALILDREMPNMNGMQLVERLKNNAQLAGIPIIMLTGTGDAPYIQEGIDAGVHYYLVKPVDNTLLHSVITSALRERWQKITLMSELNRHGAALKAMRHCHIAIETIEEAEDTACFLASCFPEPERVVSGLMELLINAVEHGNLGITYEEKQQLLERNLWREELLRRADLSENIGKKVNVIYQHKAEGYLVQITDCGEGFDWKRYWHINPARATASHGRGIARARIGAFDRLSYNEKGNSVTAMIVETAAAPEQYAW